jgi:hypothetical protein
MINSGAWALAEVVEASRQQWAECAALFIFRAKHSTFEGRGFGCSGQAGMLPAPRPPPHTPCSKELV